MKQVNQQEKLLFSGLPWEYRGSPQEFPGSAPWEFCETTGSSLASLETVAAMTSGGSALMFASPLRPGQDQGRTTGRGKEQASQQMARLRDREWTHIGGHDSIWWVVRLFGGRIASSKSDAGKPRQSQHDQSDMQVIRNRSGAHYSQ